MHLKSVTHCTDGVEVDGLTVDTNSVKRNLCNFLYLNFVHRGRVDESKFQVYFHNPKYIANIYICSKPRKLCLFETFQVNFLPRHGSYVH